MYKANQVVGSAALKVELLHVLAGGEAHVGVGDSIQRHIGGAAATHGRQILLAEQARLHGMRDRAPAHCRANTPGRTN